jgi:hypothetical protein
MERCSTFHSKNAKECELCSIRLKRQGMILDDEKPIAAWQGESFSASRLQNIASICSTECHEAQKKVSHNLLF